MKVKLLKGDITKQDAEAIVVAANSYLAGNGEKYDSALHLAAGPELAKACRQIGICRPGEAKLTPAYNLSADFVIHTVGPTWRGGVVGEKNILTSCYINSIDLAFKYQVDTIAFSLLGIGAPHGVPKKEAITVALSTLLQFEDDDIEISLVLANSDTFMMANRILAQLTRNNKPTEPDDDSDDDDDDFDEE